MFKKGAYREHREGKNPLEAVTRVCWFCAVGSVPTKSTLFK